MRFFSEAEERIEICPLLNTVSSGSLRNNSASERPNVATEEDVGVRIGSIWREERRISGVLVDNRCGRVEWRRVIGSREVGQRRDGRARREGRRARGPAETGVRMRLNRVNFHCEFGEMVSHTEFV